MGDLLFAIANLARKLGIEPETALRKANDKFTRRFTAMEAGDRQVRPHHAGHEPRRARTGVAGDQGRATSSLVATAHHEGTKKHEGHEETPFSKHDTANALLQERDIEVYEQAQPRARQPQVAHHLGDVNGVKILD